MANRAVWSRYWPYRANRKCEAGLATPLGRFAKTVDSTHRKGTGPVEPMTAARQGWVARIGRFVRELWIAVAASEVRATR